MKLEEQYPILATLKRLGIPLTRANYLALGRWDDPKGKTLDAEEEFELPPAFRRHVPWVPDGTEMCQLHSRYAFSDCPWCEMNHALQQ